ncbi:MAG: glycosyltransferase family 9 protein [Vicinamibacterales bacterium]
MPLHISDRRERALVAAADRAFAALTAIARPFGRRQPPRAPKRILVLRLERIGDLLMTLPALADLRAFAPGARIDLVVGSWNGDLARAIDPVTRVLCLDASWLARESQGQGILSLMAAARRWRGTQYDLAINFEPDIRGNLMLSVSGAAWTAGYRSAGGGPLLDAALDYDTSAHTSDNARRLVAAVFDSAVPEEQPPTLVVPSEAHENASRLLIDAGHPLIGIHVSGGRAIKQWPAERFAEVARRLVEHAGATIVLSGGATDRPMVETVKSAVPASRVVDVAGHIDLLTLAGLTERLDLLVTGDTGPMHLAVAVGTPVVAVFGPSDPARYGPRGPLDRVVRVDLPCSPCNRIRLPPARCVGHTPDCLEFVTVNDVFSAAVSVLERSVRSDVVPMRLLPND